VGRRNRTQPENTRGERLGTVRSRAARAVLADMTDDQPKRGRPSDYSFQVAISICARLAEGKSLRAICSEAGMPGRATVFRWIARHKEFTTSTHSPASRAEDLADEMIEIADDPCVWVKKTDRMAGRLSRGPAGRVCFIELLGS
jgi:hypothetical protein